MHMQRSFFAGLLAGFLFVAGMYFGLLYWQSGTPTDDSHWCYEINRTKQWIAEQCEQPKILLVGGSSTLFGINARQIERALRVPTVNLGTHAALGLPYILALAQKAARPGDTILLALEYDLYERGNNVSQWAGEDFISFMLARDTAYFRQLTLCDQLRLGMGVSFPRLRKGILHRLAPQPPPSYKEFYAYDPSVLDDRGDITGHTEARRTPEDATKFSAADALARGLPNRPGGFPVIARFNEWARSRGIRVIATFPSTCRRPEYDRACARQAVHSITELFCRIGVPIAGSAEAEFLPASEFFDTGYHLTQEASQRHTQRLLSQLAPYFPAPPQSNLSPSRPAFEQRNSPGLQFERFGVAESDPLTR
jgi:hypothetical protein